MGLQFFTPQFFDGLVLVMTAIGLVFAARRIIYDFRRGLRYLDPPTKPHPPQETQP